MRYINLRLTYLLTYMLALRLLKNEKSTRYTVERIYLRQRNKTILKTRLALAPCRQYVYVGSRRRKIPRSSAACWQPGQGCEVP